MIFKKLPSDCIYHIFEYLEDNYETLYSCILVNRSWFRLTAPILWKDPFHSKNSAKTMIKCLSKESKDFFVKNNIKLSFEVLDDDKPLLCNYSAFANELRMEDTSYDNSLDLIDEEIELVKKEKWYLLLKELVKHIMTNSRIERISLHYLEHYLLLEQPKFSQCFSNLKELACNDSISSELFHLLAQTTNQIEIFGLEFYNYKPNMGLVKLIRAQKHIKKLLCFTSNDSIPKLVKDALLLHANDLVEYTSIGCCDLDYTLSDFKNLKSLNLHRYNLVNDFDDIFIENLNFNLLEKINVNFDGQDCVYTLSEFFKLNGKNLKVIQFDGYPNDPEFLEEFIGSIAQHCPNLEYLSLIYDSNVAKDLCKVFSTCTKLKGIAVRKIDDLLPTFEDLFFALMTILPQQIRILSFRQKCLLLDDVLEMFFERWTGYAPIYIEIFNGEEEIIDGDIGNEVNVIELLTRYKEKGLLDFSVADSIPKFDMFLESL